MVRNVIVACDGSDQSSYAVAYAANNLCRGDFMLHLVSVLPPVTLLLPGGAVSLMAAKTSAYSPDLLYKLKIMTCDCM